MSTQEPADLVQLDVGCADAVVVQAEGEAAAAGLRLGTVPPPLARHVPRRRDDPQSAGGSYRRGVWARGRRREGIGG